MLKSTRIFWRIHENSSPRPIRFESVIRTYSPHFHKFLSKEFYCNGSSLAMGKCLDLMRWMTLFGGCLQPPMSFANLTKFLWKAVLTKMVVHAAPSHERQLRTHCLPSLSGAVGVYTIIFVTRLCAAIVWCVNLRQRCSCSTYCCCCCSDLKSLIDTSPWK
jgi:hypothetical protein